MFKLITGTSLKMKMQNVKYEFKIYERNLFAYLQFIFGHM